MNSTARDKRSTHFVLQSCSIKDYVVSSYLGNSIVVHSIYELLLWYPGFPGLHVLGSHTNVTAK